MACASVSGVSHPEGLLRSVASESRQGLALPRAAEYRSSSLTNLVSSPLARSHTECSRKVAMAQRFLYQFRVGISSKENSGKVITQVMNGRFYRLVRPLKPVLFENSISRKHTQAACKGDS